MCLCIVIRGLAAAARYRRFWEIGVRGTCSLFLSLSVASFIGPTKFARVDMHGRLGKCSIKPSRAEMRGAFLRAGNKNLGSTTPGWRCGIYTAAINPRANLTACIIDCPFTLREAKEYKFISCAKRLSLEIFTVILITAALNWNWGQYFLREKFERYYRLLPNILPFSKLLSYRVSETVEL